jgi:hypothetical protein
LKAEYDEQHEIDLNLKHLSDEDMLRVMADENAEEWTTNATNHNIETVRAVVQAFAAGKISLELPNERTNASHIRNAPYFTHAADAPPARAQHPYTAQTVAKFLGWVKSDGEAQSRVRDALAALELIEAGLIPEGAFAELTTKQAGAVIAEARQSSKSACGGQVSGRSSDFPRRARI